MRSQTLLSGSGLLLLLLAAACTVPTASAHPCDGVPPGGNCTIDMDCTPPESHDDGRRTSTCTYTDGSSSECEVYAQADGSELYACPSANATTRGAGGALFAAWTGAAVALLGGGWLLYSVAAPRSLTVPMVPLFSRVEKSRALEHPRRQAVYHFIETNPGVRFTTMRRELELPNGDLRHHLRVLQLHGLIVAERQRGRTFFRLPGTRLPEQIDPEAARLLELVRQGESSLASVCAELGWSRSKARHWAKRLKELGLIDQQRVGRERRLRYVSFSGTDRMPIAAAG